MKISEIFIIENWISHGEGNKFVIKKKVGKQLKDPDFLYRVVSQGEMDSIEKLGYIKPSEFYQRVHASVEPELKYRDGKDSYLLKIKYDPKDEWLAKDGDKLYAVTWNKIPKSRIVNIKETIK